MHLVEPEKLLLGGCRLGTLLGPPWSRLGSISQPLPTKLSISTLSQFQMAHLHQGVSLHSLQPSS